jgi:Holliday junction resolvasome RuvABC endonuclease subunit
MKILGLDMGTTAGAALQDAGGLRVWEGNFTPRRGASYGLRFIEFSAWLDSIYSECQFQLVAYEQIIGISNRGGQSAQQQIWGGFLATLAVWCDARSIDYVGLSVTACKKLATGKGNASKDEMLAAFESATGLSASHDVADAYWVMRLAEWEFTAGTTLQP